MEQFDVVFSLGPYCRPAYYLELCHLRKCAYPMDWQGSLLESTLSLYENEFQDFFTQYRDFPKLVNDKEQLRYVVDTKYHVISMHHIKSNLPLDSAVKEFRKLMMKRYHRLDQDLKNAKSILIVGNHNRKINILKEFLVCFSKKYSNKKITFVNIHSRKNGKNKYVHVINEYLTIIEIFFYDVHKDGADPSLNKNFWLGNEEKWTTIINQIKKGNL